MRYDFLSFIFGLLILIFPAWAYFTHNELFQQLLENKFMLYLIFGILGVGFSILVIGFREIYQNYSKNKEIAVRMIALKKYELDKELKPVPEKYKEDIIDEKTNLILKLKKRIKKIKGGLKKLNKPKSQKNKK